MSTDITSKFLSTSLSQNLDQSIGSRRTPPATTTVDSSAFFDVGSLHLLSNSGGVEITELARLWDEQPAGDGNLDGADGWVTSPDLASYGVPPTATAVLLQTKAKVLTKTWSNLFCEGEMQVGLRPTGSALPGNAVNFARGYKLDHLGTGTLNGGVTTESISYNTTPVRLTNGTFDIYTTFSIKNNVRIERDVYLLGYYGN